MSFLLDSLIETAKTLDPVCKAFGVKCQVVENYHHPLHGDLGNCVILDDDVICIDGTGLKYILLEVTAHLLIKDKYFKYSKGYYNLLNFMKESEK